MYSIMSQWKCRLHISQTGRYVTTFAGFMLNSTALNSYYPGVSPFLLSCEDIYVDDLLTTKSIRNVETENLASKGTVLGL